MKLVTLFNAPVLKTLRGKSSLREVIELLTDILRDIPMGFRDSAKIEFYVDDDSVFVEIGYQRPLTPEEKMQVDRNNDYAAKEREKRDFEKYLELKKRFGGL